MSKDLLKDLKDEEVSNNRIDEDLKENSVINIVKEFIPYVIILVAVNSEKEAWEHIIKGEEGKYYFVLKK